MLLKFKKPPVKNCILVYEELSIEIVFGDRSHPYLSYKNNEIDRNVYKKYILKPNSTDRCP